MILKRRDFITLLSGAALAAAVHRARTIWLAPAIALVILIFAGMAEAATIKILALGASNTNGKGVSTSDAWPAQLESMLRAKGYDATVKVNAVNGDTSAGVLSRTSAIPAGTQVVAFDTGGDNDLLHGLAAETQVNRAKIISAIRADGAVAIGVPYRTLIGPQRSGGAGYQADGIHLTAQSHRKVAAYLVPLVIAAVSQSH
jgi:acyl-CoA thioesterase I